MPGCPRIPQRRHVELVANFETGNMGLKKDPGLHALSRSLCHEVCPVRDCGAPVVPRQEEISGAATAVKVIYSVKNHLWPFLTMFDGKCVEGFSAMLVLF